MEEDASISMWEIGCFIVPSCGSLLLSIFSYADFEGKDREIGGWGEKLISDFGFLIPYSAIRIPQSSDKVTVWDTGQYFSTETEPSMKR
jgi:hypothetical protein